MKSALANFTDPLPPRYRDMQALGRVMAEIEWVAGLFPVIAGRSGRVVIMFTDIQGFTTLAARDGDHAALRLLRRHDRAIMPAIRAHDGRIVKRLGDGLMVAFTRPTDALAAALAIRRETSGVAGLAIRIGMHRGMVRSHDGDLVGHAVNVASRIGARARGDEILVSGTIRRAVDARGAMFRPVEALTLTAGAPVPLYRVLGRAGS